MNDRAHPQPTGRLNEPSAVRALQFDDVVATYVVDGVLALQAAEFFPAVPTEYWSSGHGLFDSGARMVMSAGGLLIERDGGTLLIDAGLGPTTEDSVVGPINSGSMLDVLGSLGRRPEDIDVLAFTHLHFDHTGWAFTHGPDGVETKTFPNARYLVSTPEWAPYAHGEDVTGFATSQELIRMLAASHTEFADGDEIFPGVRAVVTPGHSAGHTSYVITSATTGGRLVVFGDAFHIPAQLAHPEWPSAPDIDVQSVKKARRRVLDELTQPNTFGFAFHFGDQPFGRVTTNGGKPAWEPIPTTVHAPAPRTFA
jgi:glyoxylase-like metal-dependent hydrolase (beta-lactamase superfamily II)